MKKGKKQNRSLFYRISAWLHLWLGLASGIVVVIVSLTGAALTFEEELRVLLQPYQKVQDEGRPLLPPSVLADAVKKTYHVPGVSAVIYRGRDRSAVIPWYGDQSNYLVNFVNPYTAEPLHSQPLNSDFFRIMIEGHYQLWLPRDIGKPIVAYSTLIFVITLITGLVLWWPKKWTTSTRRQSFFVRTKATIKRLNYDLHNVLGFYAISIALVLALTGMVFGMEWFSKTVYWTASGGQEKSFSRVSSDTTLVAIDPAREEDRLFASLNRADTDFGENMITIGYPFGKAGTWSVAVNPDMGKRFREQRSYYEQKSLRLLKKDPAFSEGNGGDKLSRLNYDLHVGAIGGITTKIIAFLACIISASLPVTGFVIWFGKKRKQKKKSVVRRAAVTINTPAGSYTTVPGERQ
ncbi:MAG: PepSY domain-containing protein [Chitinophagaceae bacterium]|nr:MAG: PepSY domain-containing protein [Chitinophagaceae bacterium]